MNKPNKIAILGNSGSGKSTLASKLGQGLSLPVHHIDLHFYVEEAQLLTDKEWTQRLTTILAKDKWVVEGGGDNLELRIEKADIVVFIDIPTYVCLWRIVKRYVLYKLQKPHLAEPYHNALSWTMLKYLLTFNNKNRPEIRLFLDQYKNTKKIVVIKSGSFGDNFLNDLMGQKL